MHVHNASQKLYCNITECVYCDLFLSKSFLLCNLFYIKMFILIIVFQIDPGKFIIIDAVGCDFEQVCGYGVQTTSRDLNFSWKLSDTSLQLKDGM